MKMPEKLGTIVAKRDLVSSVDGAKKVSIQIGKPVLPKGDWTYVCPYRIHGIGDDRLRHAPGGADSVDSLQFVFQKIGIELTIINEAHGGTLHWEGGAEGDVSFPLWERIEKELKK